MLILIFLSPICQNWVDLARSKEEKKNYLKGHFYLNFKQTKQVYVFPSDLKLRIFVTFRVPISGKLRLITLSVHVKTSPLGSHGSTGRHYRPWVVLHLASCLVFRVFFCQLFTGAEENWFCGEFVDCLKAKRLFPWELLFCCSIYAYRKRVNLKEISPSTYGCTGCCAKLVVQAFIYIIFNRGRPH